MELGPRSLLVFDYTGKVNGLLTSMDLLKGIIPGYLKDSKVSMADSVRYSPMFWTGMFKREVQDLARKKIKEIMSPPPLTIEGETNLMEAAYMMVKNNVRRLVVVRLGKVIGVIRDQDLFFAMERRD
jgi:predicted transcriptional regulator